METRSLKLHKAPTFPIDGTLSLPPSLGVIAPPFIRPSESQSNDRRPGLTKQNAGFMEMEKITNWHCLFAIEMLNTI
jgi:hypothetical protein